MEQPWVRAVRVEEADTVLHIVLQCNTTKAAAAAAASNGHQDATYQLCVLDAQGSTAWSSSFSRDDVEEALRQVRPQQQQQQQQQQRRRQQR
uniref:Uncharacterized protein n=1 Tax=Tetradesmus obliquus TaxID=3088 RepID=A0A383VTC2_TETOB